MAEEKEEQRPVGKNAVIVHPRQRNNPVINYIKQVPIVFDETIKPDFVTGATSCVLFLSLKYHKLKPEYIYKRMSQLGRDFELRVLLLHADIENPSDEIRDLTSTCIHHDFTMLVAWSVQEAGAYISELKKKEKVSLGALRAQTKKEYNQQLAEVLTKVRGVNKTDVRALSRKFGSFRDIIRSASQVKDLQGWGPAKTQRFTEAISTPFGTDDPYAARFVGNPEKAKESAR